MKEQNNNLEAIDNMAKQLWEMRHTDSFHTFIIPLKSHCSSLNL
jgi:hypothetical protein